MKKLFWIAIASLVMGCGVKDYVMSRSGLEGELRIDNNTAHDAEVYKRKCGDERPFTSRLGTVKAGNKKTFNLDEDCYELHAINDEYDEWYQSTMVQNGMATTVWVLWD